MRKLFLTLLKDGEIVRQETIDDPVLNSCHRFGWVYADSVKPSSIRFTLPTPIHAVLLSWILEPRNTIPSFSTLFDLVVAAMRKFKPSQMQLAIRRAGMTLIPADNNMPPDAQYQDELYRTMLDVTHGNVCISPEFASAEKAKVAGRIDFYIQSRKWGIEITRDGKLLQQHSDRFKPQGAYGKWLSTGEMDDYILLDCRQTVPRAAHPSRCHLCFVGVPH
jgi:hypothetical protein